MSHWITGLVTALALAGSTFVASEPAQARVSVGIGVGIPGPVITGRATTGVVMTGVVMTGAVYDYDAYCDPRSRYYDPYYCDDAAYDAATTTTTIRLHRRLLV